MTRVQVVRVQEVISRTRIGANKVATAETRAQQVAPRRDVISSGNSVHVTITIASRVRRPARRPPLSRFLQEENLPQFVTRRAADPSEQNWAKTVGNGF